MEYKKIINNEYTLHLVNTNRFKTINVVMFLTKKFNKNDIPYGNLLVQNLLYTSKKYNTKAKMSGIYEDLYGCKVSGSFGFTGMCESFVFSLDFINPKYTSNKYYDKTLDYFKEILFNPNVLNNKFNQKYFDILKQDNISSIKSIKDNPRIFSSIEYSKLMYKGTPGEFSAYPKLENIEKITSEDLYNFYKTLFNGNYKIDVIVLGEISDAFKEKLENILSFVKGNNKKLSFKVEHKYDTKLIKKIDSLPFNQSRLYIGYRLLNFNYHEMLHVMRVYNTILGTMNDSILFNIVREENSLCYTVGSYYSRYNPSLTIYAGINKKNYEQTVELIKKCVDDMSNKNKVKRLFESAKKTINTYLNNYYDDVSLQINKYYDSEFETIEDVETLRNNINKVTIDEIINLNKKIKLSTIYLLKGDN